MNQEPYLNRKEYLDTIRNQFDYNLKKNNPPLHQTYDNEEPYVGYKGGFFKLRFVISILLILGFVYVKQTDWSYQKINASYIQQYIQSTPKPIKKLSKIDLNLKN